MTEKQNKPTSKPTFRKKRSERPTINLPQQATDDIPLNFENPSNSAIERKSLIPRYDTNFQPRTHKKSNSPVYINDYQKLLEKMGLARFQASFPTPFLVGIGTVGILESGVAFQKDLTSEVFLQSMSEEPTSNPSLGGRVWKLTPAEDRQGKRSFTLGRSMVNDVVIPEFAISRKHCEFRFDNEHKRLLVKDLSSHNGTIVGKKRLDGDELVPLKNMDIVILGRFTFQVFSPAGMIKALHEWGLQSP
ncbi:MAG: FHA domain-containing protein [Myxococcota bacterium]|nr:FHA domain-containing protein [Myxococcota bacterium]